MQSLGDRFFHGKEFKGTSAILYRINRVGLQLPIQIRCLKENKLQINDCALTLSVSDLFCITVFDVNDIQDSFMTLHS